MVGHDGGMTCALVGLHRTGGIMVYDLSDPEYVEILYLDEAPVHVSAEGPEFVPARDSPTGKALLMVAHEISGTSTGYETETEWDQYLVRVAICCANIEKLTAGLIDVIVIDDDRPFRLPQPFQLPVALQAALDRRGAFARTSPEALAQNPLGHPHPDRYQFGMYFHRGMQVGARAVDQHILARAQMEQDVVRHGIRESVRMPGKQEIAARRANRESVGIDFDMAVVTAAVRPRNETLGQL